MANVAIYRSKLRDGGRRAYKKAVVVGALDVKREGDLLTIEISDGKYCYEIALPADQALVDQCTEAAAAATFSDTLKKSIEKETAKRGAK